MGINYAELMEDAEGASENNQTDGNFLENFVLMPKGDGITVVRILPPGPGNALPMMAGGLCMFTRVHSVNGRKVHCPRVKGGIGRNGKPYYVGNCRICDHYGWCYDEARNCKAAGDLAGEESHIRQAREIKPVERYYLNAIVRQVKKDNGVIEYNVGPKILSVGQTVWQKIRQALLGNEKLGKLALGDITNTTSGRDFRIIKIDKLGNDGNKYPNYDESDWTDPCPAGTPDQVSMWMANLHDLAALRVLRSPEEIEAELREHLGGPAAKQKKTYNPTAFMNSGTEGGVGAATVAVTINANIEDAGTVSPAGGAPNPYTPASFDEIAPPAQPDVPMNSEDFFSKLKGL